jgi:hypothetical protein
MYMGISKFEKFILSPYSTITAIFWHFLDPEVVKVAHRSYIFQLDTHKKDLDTVSYRVKHIFLHMVPMIVTFFAVI